MLKISANKDHENKVKEYINPLVIAAYILFFTSALLTTRALVMIPLKYAPIIESVGYIYILILSRLILKEEITKNKIIGNMIILIGIIIFSY